MRRLVVPVENIFKAFDYAWKDYVGGFLHQLKEVAEADQPTCCSAHQKSLSNSARDCGNNSTLKAMLIALEAQQSMVCPLGKLVSGYYTQNAHNK